MTGIFKTQKESEAMKVLTWLSDVTEVGFMFQDGWYEIVTRYDYPQPQAAELNRMAKAVATSDFKSQPLRVFKQLERR